jgi:hypothetical protein
MEDTKTIETPFKKFKVEIKTFLTAKDELEIEKIFYDAAVIKNGIVTEITGSKGEVIINTEKRMMEAAVVSINGEKEKIVEKLLNMAEQDYAFVKAEVEKIRDYTQVKKK